MQIPMALQKDLTIALFIAFAVCAVLSKFLIPVLRRLKIGQTEREEGLDSHKKKRVSVLCQEKQSRKLFFCVIFKNGSRGFASVVTKRNVTIVTQY